MPVSVLAFSLPRAEQAPGSVPSAPRPVLTEDAQLRLGVHYATQILQPLVLSARVNVRRVARLSATAIAVNAPQGWTVADLVDWLTTSGPEGDAE